MVTCAGLLVEAQHPVVGQIAEEQATLVGEIDRALGPAQARVQLLQEHDRDRVASEALVELSNGSMRLLLSSRARLRAVAARWRRWAA